MLTKTPHEISPRLARVLLGALRRISVALPLVASLLVADCGGRIDPQSMPGDAGEDGGAPHVRFAVVSRITGPAAPIGACPAELRIASANDTGGRWNVGGTDLGIMWESGPNEIAMAFGDTFASPDQEGDWRHNVLAFSGDRDPADGITVSRMIEDRPGHAGEVIGPTPGIAHEGLIPTAGVALDGRQVLFFMSVAHWGVSGVWSTNYSSIATSDDGGAHWTRSDARWPATSGFAQVGLVRDGGFLYVFGTPAGRFGALHLARVAEADVLDASAYAYYDGHDWRPGDERVAAEILPAGVGELSIRFNRYSGLWRMTYLNQGRGAIVLRTAPALTGPWSDEIPLIERRDPSHPLLYGGFQHPWFNDGPDLYVTVSKMACYDVFLARLTLDPPR